MNANFHPYHYSPIVEVSHHEKFISVELHSCNFEPDTDLLIEHVPVYFTSIHKAGKFLSKNKTSAEFHGKLRSLEEIEEEFIVDPCASCGYYEIQNKKTLATSVATIKKRVDILKALAVQLLNEKNHDDAFMVCKSILNHLDPVDAEAHYTIGIIGIGTNDQALVSEAEQSLRNIDIEWFEKLIKRKQSFL